MYTHTHIRLTSAWASCPPQSRTPEALTVHVNVPAPDLLALPGRGQTVRRLDLEQLRRLGISERLAQAQHHRAQVDAEAVRRVAERKQHHHPL